MYQYVKAAVLCSAACLAGCGAERADKAGPSTSGAPARQAIANAVDPMTRAHVGEVEYAFDPTLLVRAEIQVAIPPGFKSSVWATKLIPVERAELLGQKVCEYPGARSARVCVAEKEGGLSLALLERPIADYREALDGEEAIDTQIDEAAEGTTASLEFVDQSPQEVVEYAFYEVGERTLMVKYRHARTERTLEPALDQVLQSLVVPSRTGSGSSAPPA